MVLDVFAFRCVRVSEKEIEETERERESETHTASARLMRANVLVFRGKFERERMRCFVPSKRAFLHVVY